MRKKDIVRTVTYFQLCLSAYGEGCRHDRMATGPSVMEGDREVLS